MQRLFEGEERAASITASAPCPRLITQASNFSFLRRSAAFAVTITVSIPNWRKPSDSNARAASSRPTSAVRAAAFRTIGAGGKDVAQALSIGGEEAPLSKSIVEAGGPPGKKQKGTGGSDQTIGHLVPVG